ncbi:hypothetical protein [Pseudomonas fluorescens]|uniref:hypothetical protein n=1 Tax=Pseudomonas TaxID=286 RepID=UPI003CFD95DF
MFIFLAGCCWFGKTEESETRNGFFVLIIPYWTFMYFPSIGRAQFFQPLVGRRRIREKFGVVDNPIASRLAPTVGLHQTQFLCTTIIQCGSEPARDSGLTVNEETTDVHFFQRSAAA